MAKLYRQKLLLRLLTLGVLVLCLCVVSRYDRNTSLARVQTPSVSQIQTRAPILLAAAQNNSPLRISSAPSASVDLQLPEVRFSIKNVSGKPVRAYMLKQIVKAGEKEQSSGTLTNLELKGAVLQPEESIVEVETYEILSEKQHYVAFSVDYVEFTDGSTWGTDSFKASEVTAGQRAGAFALTEQLLSILNSKGTVGVQKAIEDNESALTPPENHSDDWQRGFRSGGFFVRAHLKHLYSKGEGDKAESDLRHSAEKH